MDTVYAALALAWAYLNAHPGYLVLASLVVNGLLYLVPPERLVQLAEQRPRLVAAIRFLRAVGIDPVAAIRALQLLLASKAASASGVLSMSALEAPPTLRTGQAPGAGGEDGGGL